MLPCNVDEQSNIIFLNSVISSDDHLRNVKVQMLDILQQLVEESASVPIDCVEIVLHRLQRKQKVCLHGMHEKSGVLIHYHTRPRARQLMSSLRNSSRRQKIACTTMSRSTFTRRS